MKRLYVIPLLLVLSFPCASLAADGILFMSPARGAFPMDQEFEVSVRADTGGAAANAAEADISFNPSALAVVRIETEGSVLSLWPTPPEYSNTKGTIRFSGTAGAGFTSREALLIRIIFRPISIMPGDVQIDSGAILLNDARATNIIASMQSGLYTITALRTLPAPLSATGTLSESDSPVGDVKGASIQVPTISGYDDVVSAGERIIVQGSAGPDTTVHIVLQHDNDAPREGTVMSAHDGTFTYASREPAQDGEYRVWAEVRTDAETYSSDNVVMTARAQGLGAAALVPALTFGVPILLLLIAGVIGVSYYYGVRTARGDY